MVYNGGQLGIVAFIEAKFKLTSAVKFIVVNMILAGPACVYEYPLPVYSDYL